ncbi:tetratricopeptide repeat protein [Merismopedia glauca]|uniref:Tetratricopeptide repeat-containing protein n=1 Tax=Merismopedia glauca CCAP 1448/3 TaxID=1296344 RepID=A0A2T1C583_9CYAN|nr:tetratricopeptide repeat protein [Merismopedia glauca]PSB03430.1 tetratricopeptide repeat-containing protein [Merismopedia glauca CCAP 1448/3]
MSQTSSRKPLQKILVLVTGFAFIASSIFGVVSMFNQSQPDPQQTQNAQSSQITQLKQQQQGFESVLKREPNNETALQGVAQIKLELNDYKGAIPYLEKLVKLNPNKPSYQALLARVKQEASNKNK